MPSSSPRGARDALRALQDAFWPFSWHTAANYFLLLYLLGTLIIILNPRSLFTTLRSYVPLVYASSIAFIMFFIGCQQCSPSLHPMYSKLPPLHQQHWNMRLMSSLHAILVSFLAAMALICDPNLHADLLQSWSPIVGFTVALFLGYCAVDTWLTLANHDKALGGGPAIIIHHAMVMMIALFPLGAQDFGMITACYLLNEMSTPFMNMIHFFRDVEFPKSHKLVLANSIAFMVSYFFCRVCVNTYVMVALLLPSSSAWSYPKWRLICGGTFVIAFWILNLYWFYKIISHAWKVLCVSPKESDQPYEAVADLSGDDSQESDGLDISGKVDESDFELDQYEMA